MLHYYTARRGNEGFRDDFPFTQMRQCLSLRYDFFLHLQRPWGKYTRVAPVFTVICLALAVRPEAKGSADQNIFSLVISVSKNTSCR